MGGVAVTVGDGEGHGKSGGHGTDVGIGEGDGHGKPGGHGSADASSPGSVDVGGEEDGDGVDPPGFR